MAKNYYNILVCFIVGCIALHICFPFLFHCFYRRQYPFGLDWKEGGSLCHVQRILERKNLYCQASVEFVPFIYISAAFSRVLGLSFFTLRLVSLLSTLGCTVLIVMFVLKRTVSRFASYLAMCFFFATFKLSGTWFEIVRVDMVFMLFLLLSLNLYQLENQKVNSLLVGLFLFLPLFTKQTALLIA